jgi:hypothetical protein
MDNYLKKLIKDFPGKDFKSFVGYVYTTLQKEIDLKKKEVDKNKYIKIQKCILPYIISNEKLIISQLHKKNK